MYAMQSVVDPVLVIAWVKGTLVALAVVGGLALAIYAIYWIAFKMRK